MESHVSALKSLHTILIDSLNGYRTALDEAGGKGLTRLFNEMIALRTQQIDQVSVALQDMGAPTDSDGSFLTTVHKAVISLSALFTGLDESILPGLVDGEQRIRTYYDAALASAPVDGPERAMLVKQRDALQAKIDEMKAAQMAASPT